ASSRHRKNAFCQPSIRRQQVSAAVRPRPRSAISSRSSKPKARPAAREVQRQSAGEATVIATGPGRLCETSGQPLPVSVKVGDKVLLPEFGGTKVTLEDTRLLPVPRCRHPGQIQRLNLRPGLSAAALCCRSVQGVGCNFNNLRAAKLDSLKSLGLTNKSSTSSTGSACDGSGGTAFDNVYPASGHKTAAVRESTASDIRQGPCSLLKSWRSRPPHRAAAAPGPPWRCWTPDKQSGRGKPAPTLKPARTPCRCFSGLAHTLAGEHVHLPGGSFYYTRREPFGVCAGIGAWNYPFQMAVWKSAASLACGNGLVFKPAPLTRWAPCSWPRSTPRLACRGLFSVVQGGPVHRHCEWCPSSAAECAERTGGAEAAGRLIRPVTLELGGNCPRPPCWLITSLPGTGVQQRRPRIRRTPHHPDDFRRSPAARGRRPSSWRPDADGDGHRRHASPASTPERVLGYIGSREAEGAKRLFAGDRVEVPRPGDRPLPAALCVLANCSDGMRAVREEIFGAVLTLLEFDTEAEAVARANATEFGLSGGVFTRDSARAPQGHRRAAGGQPVYINTYNSYPPGVPFGGYKMSGFGRRELRGVAAVLLAGQVLSMWSAPASSCLPCLARNSCTCGADLAGTLV
uniref:Aldedh domain-containing protein n=1 Tax=Macrostomum lignano TaxID=282301 RepID=A0A1I8FJ28_9PLAT